MDFSKNKDFDRVGVGTPNKDEGQTLKNIVSINITAGDIAKASRTRIAGLTHKRSNSLSVIKKRKVGDTSFAERDQEEVTKKVEDPTAFVIMEALEVIAKCTVDLDKRIQENPNTKREIKEIALKLKRATEVMNRESSKEWFEKRRWTPVEIPKYDVDTQTTISGEIASHTQMMERKSNKLESLDGIKDVEDFRRCESKAWDRGLFTNTDLMVGNPVTVDAPVKIVLVEPGDEGMEKGVQKLFKDRFPDLKDASEEMEVFEQETRRRVRNGSVTSLTKIICLRHNGTIEDLWEKLRMVKDEVQHEEKIALHHVNFLTNGRLRKILECLFHRSRTKAVIYTTKRGKESRTEGGRNMTSQPQKERTTHALIVGDKGKNFNELLKEVKGKLKNTPMASAVRGLRSTRDGELLVVLEKDDEALQRMKDELLLGEQQRTIRSAGEKRTRMETVFIRGLDADAIREDVIEALTRTFGSDEEGLFKVGELRPTRNNTQTVTVNVARPSLSTLLGSGFLRVGVVSCKVERRTRVPTCNRCWEYGHKAGDCLGPDRKADCFNCGKTGHTARECEEEPACPICRVEGHKAGSGKCSAFRKALSQAKSIRDFEPEEGAMPPPID